MTTWFKLRFQREDTLGKMVLVAEIMGACGFTLVLAAFLLNKSI